MLFSLFKRKKPEVDQFQLDLENDDELYYETIAGRTPRDSNNHAEYILFIDFGSYRTSVLCWPCSFGRDKITDSWQYVVHSDKDDQGGFPSAFINPPSGDERDFAFVPNVGGENVSSSQIVKSAKYAFASKFAAYRGNVPQFKLYIKKIIEESFKYITFPNKDLPWNGPAIPVITEIRVTVPDLFIENLRAGYRENIYSVCMDLADHNKWKHLFPENLRHLRKTFVNISADESGACELYFLNLLKSMPFWDLSSQKDRMPDLQEVDYLFSQAQYRNQDADNLNFVVCHIDIGGLTTDVSILLVNSRQIYFLVSGRPTKSSKVRSVIRRNILKEFNRDELILLPEHCLFMANYYHVGKDQEGDRYAKQINHFEKLVTLIGNVYTLYDGYEIDFEDHRYYITLDVDTRSTNQMEVLPGRLYNMEEFENYKKAAIHNNVNHLAFARMATGENSTRFLTVKTIARQTSFPIIKVAQTADSGDQAWILPSLIIVNLDQNDQPFDLAWATMA